MRRTPIESKFLDELVSDCITYGLKEEEALEYIKSKFREIKSRSYQQRKAKILSEGSMRIWFDWYTRIGFVLNHKKHMEDLQKVQDDNMHQFYVETQKEPRDWRIILQLNYNIRENIKLLSELGLGTPIIAAIRSKLERTEVFKSASNFSEQ
jgi:hypothetical protein